MPFPGGEILTQILRTIGEYFRSVEWSNIYSVVSRFFIILDALVVIGIILVLPVAIKFRPTFYINPLKAYLRQRKIKKKPLFQKGQLAPHWARIMKKAESNPPQSLTLAIIEADSFVDQILKRLNLRGEHMADRLERLSAENIVSLDHLWRAHRVRNDLVHSPGFYLPAPDAKKVLKDYEAFLKEIGVI